MVKKFNIDIDGGVALIEQAADKWMQNTKGSIITVTRNAVKKLSNDPTFNLAVYLKYCYGGLYTGEENSDWIRTAKEVQKLLKGIK